MEMGHRRTLKHMLQETVSSKAMLLFTLTPQISENRTHLSFCTLSYSLGSTYHSSCTISYSPRLIVPDRLTSALYLQYCSNTENSIIHLMIRKFIIYIKVVTGIVYSTGGIRLEIKRGKGFH